jgi:hypothetical protein
MADIAAVIGVLPVNLPDQGISTLLGYGNRLPERRGAEHPSPVGDHRTVVFAGAGLEDFAVSVSGMIQAADDGALLITIRVTASSHNHADCGA